MNPINRIGVRIMGITIVALLIVFGAWKAVSFSISKYQVPTMPQSSEMPLPTLQFLPSPTPEASLSPELARELSAFTATAQQTLMGYTKKYIESLPANIPKDQVLDTKSMQAFIEKNKGDLLPKLPAGTMKMTTARGKKAIQTYLDKISSSHNKAIVPITGDAIITALGKQQSGENLEALAPIRASIEKNFGLFTAIQAPKEATSLHTKLLEATLSLINNIKLLQDMRSDVVSGLIGQRNLTDLNAAFSDIASQIAALETKYGIK